mgnify:FL=1
MNKKDYIILGASGAALLAALTMSSCRERDYSETYIGDRGFSHSKSEDGNESEVSFIDGVFGLYNRDGNSRTVIQFGGNNKNYGNRNRGSSRPSGHSYRESRKVVRGRPAPQGRPAPRRSVRHRR